MQNVILIYSLFRKMKIFIFFNFENTTDVHVFFPESDEIFSFLRIMDKSGE